jgi:tetratricopeptide (TPR) repeat protein
MGSEGVGIVLDYLSLFKLARWYHRSGVEAAERLQQPYALGPAYAGLTAHELYAGDPAQSLAHARRSIRAYREAGDLGELGLPIAYAGWISSNLGDFAQALAYSQELIRMGRDAGVRALRCWGETILGDVLHRQGKLPEAIACQQRALELAKAIPDYLYHIIAGTELALCHLSQGNWRASLSELESCQRFAIDHNVVEPYGRVSLMNNLAEVYLYAFEHDDPSERASWLDKAGRACQAGTRASSGCKLKAPKAMRLQGTYEWLKGKPAIAQQRWRRSLAEAEQMGMRYDLGLLHLEMGQRLGERKHLEKAEAIFVKMGAEGDLAKTRELLHR